MPTVSETLYRAADLVIERGLYQQDCGHGGLCVLTANRESADGNDRAEIASLLAFERYMGLAHAAAVIAWNDTPGRTAADVATALRGAAVVAELAAITASVAEVTA